MLDLVFARVKGGRVGNARKQPVHVCHGFKDGWGERKGMYIS